MVAAGQFDDFGIVVGGREVGVLGHVAVEAGLLGEAGIEAVLLGLGLTGVGEGAAAADAGRLEAVELFGEGAVGRGLDHEARAFVAGDFIEVGAVGRGADIAAALDRAGLAGAGD